MDASKPTPEDVISWIADQAFDVGEIDFTTKWDQARISELFQLNPSDVNPNTSESRNHRDGVTVLEEVTERAGKWQEDQRMKALLRKNKTLCLQTEKLVHEKLLLAGMSQEDLDELIEKKHGLRNKVVCLHRLENPEPSGSKLVQFWLLKPGTRDQMTKIYLPTNASLEEIQSCLRDLSAVLNETGETVAHGRGPWLYQVVTSEHKIRPGTLRVPLMFNEDYRSLVEGILALGSSIASAVFMQESTFTRESVMLYQPAEEENADINDLLDDNGQPYFQPVDWDALAQKEFREPGSAT